MPRRWSRNGPGLAIHLDDDGPVYPGGTMTGRITRHLPIDTLRARLTIHLRGREKVKLLNQEYIIFVPCRARSSLLGDDLHQTLYNGPLHMPAPSQSGEPLFSCPFSITLPYYDIHGRNLPFTFYTRTRTPTSTCRAFVDFWLEASLSNIASQSPRDLAIQPVSVRHPPLPLVLPPPEFHAWTCQKTVRLQRLLPGMELSRLFLADRITKTLGAPKVPQYTFRVDVICPKMVQLGASIPVPLHVKAAPVHDLSSNALAQRSRLIELKSIKVYLVARTTAVLQGTASENAKKRLCRDEEVLRAKWVTRDGEALWLPSETGEAALDVGTLILKLRFGETGVWHVLSGDDRQVFEKPIENRGVYPDFETHNIRHSHLIKWDMELKVAMETVRVQGEQLVVVLGSVDCLTDEKPRKAVSEKRRSLIREWGMRGKISGWEFRVE